MDAGLMVRCLYDTVNKKKPSTCKMHNHISFRLSPLPEVGPENLQQR
jgi:hypothetical protein